MWILWVWINLAGNWVAKPIQHYAVQTDCIAEAKKINVAYLTQTSVNGFASASCIQAEE